MTIPLGQLTGPLPAPPRDRSGASLDLELLIAVGWDPLAQVLAPDPAHPILGYPTCAVEGCDNETWHTSGVCLGCRARFDVGAGRDHR